jgi:hypothetical protein
MGFFIGRDGVYHEGDQLLGDTVCTKRPGTTYLWNGSAWVEDPQLKQDAINAQAKANLDITDDDSLRCMRSILCEQARISQWTQPPLTTDQSYLLQREQQAGQLRAQIVPPATYTLAQSKIDRIALLTQQGAAYVQLGFISLTWPWGTKKVFDILFLTLAGYQVAPLTGDGFVHLWDANSVERKLAPKDAGKLSGALYQWLYLAQKEYNAAIAAVNALTTVAAVQAYVWTTVYSVSNKFNADTYVAPTQLPAEPT